MNVCSVCSLKANHSIINAKEMMFGYKDYFNYFMCSNCECLQIEKIPENISTYYPDNYYSFQKNKYQWIINYLRKKRDLHVFGKKNILGYILMKRIGLPKYKKWLDKMEITQHKAILDVGCGAGNLLQEMADAGFNKLCGIDLFIKSEIVKKGFSIYKKEIFDLTGKFDLVMMHHVFEHMDNPLKVLKKIYSLLNQNSYLLIRIPILSAIIWPLYKEDWVQLDAPRHFFLHSAKSIGILAEFAGFEVKLIEHDSTGFQFWGSIQYQNDIPLFSQKSYLINKRKSIFSREEIKVFDKKAIELNTNKQGDQACFYLYKK